MTPQRVNGRIVVGTLMLTAMLLAVGSGGATSGASAAPSPIRIGVLCDCTGTLASSQTSWGVGVQVWKDWVNASGGLDGHSVKLFQVDTQSNSTNAIPDFMQLVQNDHVAAIIPGSTFSSSLDSLAQTDQIPMVGGTADSTVWSTNPYYFPVGTTFLNQLDGLVGAGAKSGHKKVGAFAAPGEGTAVDALFTAAAKKLNVDFTTTEELADGAPSYAAQCLAEQGAGTNAIVFLLDSATAIRAAQDCSSQGYHPTYIATAAGVTKSMTSVQALNGLIFLEQDVPFFATGSVTASFHSAFKKYDPAFVRSASYGQGALEGWASGQLVAAAITAAHPTGAITTSTVLNGLHKLLNVTLGGLAPPLNLTPGSAKSVSCDFLGVIKAGKFTTPYGVKPFCNP